MGRNNTTRPAVWVVVATMALGLLSRAWPGEATQAPGEESRCSEQERWDVSMNMCMPAPEGKVDGTVLAGQFNVFGVFSALQGPRGVDQFAAPNWFMIEAGRNVGLRQFFNIDFMGTTELWTYPRHGYPELLQVGEERGDGSPYIDAQHPHSSPVMGLTVSDTIGLADDRSLKFSFAPRGESTDGPVAYIHRRAARDMPDAPLGHHVGQDAGHISSTVLAAQLSAGEWIFEASAFNGDEPEPTHVDLPLGPLNSGAVRIIRALTASTRLMGSAAHLKQMDQAFPGMTSATRLSASLYNRFPLSGAWTVDHDLIVGSISWHPGGVTLTSFLDEVTASRARSDLWSRLEIVQRLGSELGLPDTPSVVASQDKRWVSALTVGYTYWVARNHGLELGVGSSLTADAIPAGWASAYGSRVPLTGRLIFQVRGAGTRRQ
jgi:hypothetical protein